MKLKNSFGFTLVELLVVIGIVGILAVSAIVYINPSILLKRSRDDQRLAEIKQIQSALEAYKGDKGLYPAFGTAASPVYGWSGIGNIHLNSAGGSAGAVATVTYMRKIPTGPNTGGNVCKGYVYSVATGGQSYTLFVNLEDTNSEEALSTKPTPNANSVNGTTADGYKSFYFTSGTCTGSANKFNYWVNNP